MALSAKVDKNKHNPSLSLFLFLTRTRMHPVVHSRLFLLHTHTHTTHRCTNAFYVRRHQCSTGKPIIDRKRHRI